MWRLNASNDECVLEIGIRIRSLPPRKPRDPGDFGSMYYTTLSKIQTVVKTRTPSLSIADATDTLWLVIRHRYNLKTSENTFEKIFERVIVCHRCQNFVIGHAGGTQLSHNIKKNLCRSRSLRNFRRRKAWRS